MYRGPETEVREHKTDIAVDGDTEADSGNVPSEVLLLSL